MTGPTIREERLAMLRRTLDFAVEEIPWYRDRKSQYAARPAEISEMAELPVLEPERFVEDPRAFSSSDEWPAVTAFSSGTTGPIGRPRWHALREFEALRDHAARSAGGDRGLTLDLHPFDQAPPLAVPGRSRHVHVPFLVPWHREYILRLLRGGWTAPDGVHRFTRVRGFSPGLRVLTTWLEGRGVDPASFGIEALEGYGSIQSGPWRRRLERAWSARYRDIYGLSEVKGSAAPQCPLCGAYHFLGPVVAEVLDPGSRARIDKGVGVLVLSELVPYAQLQILVRYWTGDLVEVTGPCIVDRLGVVFRGRMADSVLLGEGDDRVAVGALQTGELCAKLPEVAIAEIPWAAEAPDVGAPRFHLDGSSRVVRIRVELRFPPDLFPDRAEEVRGRLRSSLTREVSGLRDALRRERARLEVETVGPERLEERTEV